MTTQSATPATPATPAMGSAQPAPFAAMLRGALVPTLVVDALTVLAFLLFGGGRPALGALLAVTVATVFFAAGLMVMARLADATPVGFLAAALAVYLGQILFLGVVILVLADATWLDGTAFGVAALVVALAWQVFQVVAFVRMRKSVYDEQPRPSAPTGASSAAVPVDPPAAPPAGPVPAAPVPAVPAPAVPAPAADAARVPE